MWLVPVSAVPIVLTAALLFDLLAGRRRVDTSEVTIAGDDLVIRPKGSNVLMACRLEFRVPLRAIQAARRDPDPRPLLRGWRAPGAYLPRFIAAGTYRRKGKRQFWMIRGGRNAVVLELDHGPWTLAVVEVADPDRLVREVSDRIGR